MGGGRWTATDWDSHTTTRTKGKTTKEVFTSHRMKDEMNPRKISVRESRDSDDNPNSNALIVGLDVTGSMHNVIDFLARDGLNTLCEEVYNRKPITDPHIMCMGIGDVDYGAVGNPRDYGDEAPLQVTQFEADIRIAEQVNDIWLEGGGGGNMHESYHLPWYFAAMHTEIDCFDKRGKKGYLFTIGDENPPDALTPAHVDKVFGTNIQNSISMVDILAMAQQQYEVFHVMIEEGSNYTSSTARLWKDLLGEHAIALSDHKKVAEVIVSTIQLREGISKREIVESWDGSTSVVVRRALGGLAEVGEEASAGVVEL